MSSSINSVSWIIESFPSNELVVGYSREKDRQISILGYTEVVREWFMCPSIDSF
jgi:hypothetical protein